MAANRSELTAGSGLAWDARVEAFQPRPFAFAGGLTRSRPWLIVAALALAGLVLRLLLVRGLWVDEAISVHQAHMSLGGMLQNLRETDNHPPLSFLLLWATVRLFGYSQTAVHLPSIAAGTLLVPALYLTGRELFGQRTALVAAAIGAVAPLVVWYSQEARMYALFMLLATLALWAQLRVVRDGRVRFWVAYGAFTIALIYTQYFSVLPIAIQQLAFAAVVWRRLRRGEPVKGLVIGLWLTWLAILLAVLPLASYVVTQFHHDQVAGTGFGGAAGGVPAAESAPSGSSLSIYALVTNLVWAVWGYHADSTMLRIAALWPLLMLIALALLGRRHSPSTLLVLALAILPVLALLVIGMKKRDLFEVRYFAGAVPMLLLLCARGVATLSSRRLPALLAGGAMLASLGAGLADEQLNGSNPRTYDFRGAIGAIDAMRRPGDVVLYAPNYLQNVFDYYAPGIRARALSGPNPVVARGHAVFLMASFLDQPGVAPEVGSARRALARGRRLVATNTREKIAVWEYR